MKARVIVSRCGEEQDSEMGFEEVQVTSPEVSEARRGCCRDQKQGYGARGGDVVSASGDRLPDQ